MQATIEKKSTKRGASLVRTILIICIVIALLVFFNATSIEEIKNLIFGLGQGVVEVAKDIWKLIIMPVVNFFLGVLGKIVNR